VTFVRLSNDVMRNTCLGHERIQKVVKLGFVRIIMFSHFFAVSNLP